MDRYATVCDYYRESVTYAAFEQEHRRGGTFALEMIEADQDVVESIDPAVPQAFFVAMVTTVPMHAEIDFGDGWRSVTGTARTVDIQPAHQACGYRLPPVRVLGLAIDQTRLDALLSEVSAEPSALDAFSGTCREAPRARHLMDDLWMSTGGTGAPSDTLRTDGLFMTFVGEMLDACGKGTLERAVPSPGDPRLVRAIDYAREYLGTGLSVGELAGVATMSTTGFSRAFRAATGEPVWAWVKRRRCERAMELLSGTALPIVQVAERCGFASQPHLTQAFKSRYGITPGAVRRR